MSSFINNRDTKCQGELHKQLKRSCDTMQRDHFNACGDILNIFLIKEFKDNVSCTIADVVKKACATFKSYTSGSNAESYLSELAKSLGEQNKITFLPNSAKPEESLIIFDADALINTFSRRLLTSQQLSSSELSHMTDGSEIPWSQIQQHLPDLNLDPSTIASYLTSLGYRPTRHGTLRLSYSNDAVHLSTGCSTLITKLPSESVDSGLILSSPPWITTSNSGSIQFPSYPLTRDSPNSESESGATHESRSESAHQHSTCITKITNAGVSHKPESCLSTQNITLQGSENKRFVSENSNCCTQDTAESDTEWNVKLRKQGSKCIPTCI